MSLRRHLSWCEPYLTGTRLSPLSGLALICLSLFLLTGCMATQTAPQVSMIPEPLVKFVALSSPMRPTTWSLRLTRL